MAFTEPSVNQPQVTPSKTDQVIATNTDSSTVTKIDPAKNVIADKTVTTPPKILDSTVTAQPKVDDLFSTAASAIYYTIIVVNRNDVSLSSSRFGIGQFNRTNYTGQNLRHNLKELDQDQLIYIGDFTNFNDAKNYEIEISKQMSRIMKVPPANYSTFVISTENLGKVTDRATLTRYQNFIKTNEPQNK